MFYVGIGFAGKHSRSNWKGDRGAEVVEAHSVCCPRWSREERGDGEPEQIHVLFVGLLRRHRQVCADLDTSRHRGPGSYRRCLQGMHVEISR